MTTWQRVRPWISTLTRVALGVVLLVAGGIKLLDPGDAVRSVRAYELLPASLEPVVGLGLPAFEVALGVVLILGLFTRLASIAGVLLMVVFIAGIASAWARGLSIDCGCFGGGGQVAPGEEQYLSEIFRDIGFIALGVFSAIWPASPLSVDRLLNRGIAAPAYDDVDDADFDDLAEEDPAQDDEGAVDEDETQVPTSTR